jgi:hypothetical protein
MCHEIRSIGIRILVGASSAPPQSGVVMPFITDAAEPISQSWLWANEGPLGVPRWET